MDWSNLPPEILSLIFRLVSVRSVLQTALVCVNWRGSTCDPGLWKVNKEQMIKFYSTE